MITFEEFLHGHKKEDIPEEYQKNMEVFLIKINKIREAYGKAMIVTSGIRTQADQARINPKATKSNHLTGRAIDISDPKKELQIWCKNNVKLLEEVGLWMEDFGSTPNWCHFQDIAPKSGNRWFKP